MSYFHCGNGYPDHCNGYKGPLDTYVCLSSRHHLSLDEAGAADLHESLQQMRRGEGTVMHPRPAEEDQ